MRKSTLPNVTAAPLCVLPDAAVFDLDSLLACLRLKRATVRREVRLGRLRVSRRAGRYFFLASWVREWLEAGELPAHRHERNGTSPQQPGSRAGGAA